MTTPALTGPARANAAKLLASKVATQLADIWVNPKTTLTWLMTTLGAPPAWVSVLVPLRESGSMLPQVLLARWIGGGRSRVRAAMIGAGGQAAVYAALAVTVWTSPATRWLGLSIVGFVALASLLRAVASIANKDVLARAVPKGARGRIGGLATTLGGAIALLTAVLAPRIATASAQSTVVALVVFAAVAFAVATALIGSVQLNEDPPARSAAPPPRLGMRLLREDVVFRRFVIVRSLLSGTALSAPYIVLLATHSKHADLGTLAELVAASALAAALSGWLWGRIADRSARRCMGLGAALASLCVFAALGLSTSDTTAPAGLWPGVYFLFSVGYAGVRVARKTYVVDIASGELRTSYVATGNTLLAVVLLVLGALGGALHTIGPGVALGVFGGLGALGGALVTSLPSTAVAEKDPSKPAS